MEMFFEKFIKIKHEIEKLIRQIINSVFFSYQEL